MNLYTIGIKFHSDRSENYNKIFIRSLDEFVNEIADAIDYLSANKIATSESVRNLIKDRMIKDLTPIIEKPLQDNQTTENEEKFCTKYFEYCNKYLLQTINSCRYIELYDYQNEDIKNMIPKCIGTDQALDFGPIYSQYNDDKQYSDFILSKDNDSAAITTFVYLKINNSFVVLINTMI